MTERKMRTEEERRFNRDMTEAYDEWYDGGGAKEVYGSDPSIVFFAAYAAGRFDAELIAAGLEKITFSTKCPDVDENNIKEENDLVPYKGRLYRRISAK